MSQKTMQAEAANLYFALLKEGFLRKDSDLANPYIDQQTVREFVRTMATCSGVRVVMKDKYIHMLANPNGGVFSTNLSDLRKNVKGYDSKIDLYLMGVIWMVLFAEADSEMSTRISWENEGVSYQKIEELVTKVLNKWKEIDDEKDGRFSREWSLAVNDMYNKWGVLQHYKNKKGRIVYTRNSKFGLIDAAMKELEKDRMVFLREFGATTIVTPTDVFYERLQIRFGDLSPSKGRYEMIKSLIEDVNSNEVGA